MKGSDTSSHAESRRWRLFELFRHQWAGLLALTLVLGGGTAYAVDGPLAGKNTVGSEDIISGEVRTVDLASNAVTGPRVLNDSLGDAELREGSVRGSEVANESLTGADVDEVSLSLPGDVRNFHGPSQNLVLGSTFTFLTGTREIFNPDTRRLTWAVSTTMRTQSVGGNVKYAMCYRTQEGVTTTDIGAVFEGSFFPDRFDAVTVSNSSLLNFTGLVEVGLCAKSATSNSIEVHTGEVGGWMVSSRP